MGRHSRRAPQDWYHTARLLLSVIGEQVGCDANVEVGRKDVGVIGTQPWDVASDQ